jgi:hypothetical protein
MDNSIVDIVGEVLYQGSGASAVAFQPRNKVPVDGNIFLSVSYVRILGVAATGGTPNALVQMDSSLSSIDNMRFYFSELNGGGNGSTSFATYGLLVTNPTSNTSFEQNTINIDQIHLVSGAGLQIGTSTTYQANNRQNTWQIGGINLAGSSAVGIDTFGQYDNYTIGGITNEEGTFAYGLYFQGGSTNNNVTIGSVLGATTASYKDYGTYNYIVGGNLRGTPSYNVGSGVIYSPDGMIYQYLTSATATSAGVFNSFYTNFNTLLSAVATPSNSAVAIKALATTSGITITSATSANPTCYVWAIGR